MEEIQELLVRDVVLSNKTLRQADNILKTILEKDAKQAIIDLSNLFCEQNSKLFPNNFLQHAIVQIRGKELAEEFKNLCSQKLISSFWESSEPNVCALINYWTMYGNQLTFEGNEVNFVKIICKNILKFPQHSFKYLPKVIESFVAFTENFDFGISIQSLDNDFESTKLLSYFTTAFLNVANHEMNYESLGAIRFIASSMLHLHSTETLQGVYSGNHLTDHLKSKMTKQRMVLLLAELSREMKNPDDALVVFDRAYNMSKTTTDPDILTNCYNAVTLTITTITKMMDRLPQCAELMLRDFSTANDQVRLALCRLFDAIIKRAEKDGNTYEICHYFIDEFLDIPWNSKLKKYVMPTLLQYVHPDKSIALLETLLKASDDQNNKPFIAKCIASFTGLREICISFIDVMISDALKTPQTSSLMPFNALLFPLLRENKDLVSLMKEKTDKTEKQFARAWLRFELVVAAPSVAKEKGFVDSLRGDLIYGRSSGNWDLRCRSLHAFAYAGFPHNEKDCEDFLNDMEKILLTDSSIHQTAIADSFSELIKRIQAQGKKFSTIDTVGFMSKIVTIASRHMGSNFIPSQRKFAFDICNNVWKYFPEIGSLDDMTMLASLLNDRAFDIRQHVISTMRMHAQRQEIKNHFASLNYEDVDKFVLRAEEKASVIVKEEDFPSLDADLLCKLKLLLARGDTIIDKSSFFTEKIFEIASSDNLQSLHWEIQSEFYSAASYICSKLKNDINHDKIDQLTRTVFNSLFNTRIPGYVCQSVDTLERLLKLCYFIGRDKVASDFSQTLIDALSSYDMANMRRSAGLPFLALALIRSEPADSPLNLFTKLITALIGLVRSTSSSVEAANAMNIMKAIVNESASSSKCEPLFGEILSCIFDACYRFKSWDVISAVNLTLVAFLHKTCNIGGVDAAASTSIIRFQFFAKIQNSRETILRALKSSCTHANYMALGILELFKADTGDDELANAVMEHLSSKISRVRRVAARALLAVAPIASRKKLFDYLSEKMCGHGWNNFHGCALAMRAICEVEDVTGCFVPYMDVNVIPPMAREDYLVAANAVKLNLQELRIIQGTFISDEASALAYNGQFSQDMTERTLVPLIRKWGDKEVPQPMIEFLLSKIINDDVLNANEAFSINASQFLAKKLKPNSIPSSKLDHIISLITNAHSVALRASLIALIGFVENPNISSIERCSELFVDSALDFSSKMTPVHISLASITSILIRSEKLLPVAFLLVMNDIPLVRTLIITHINEDIKCEEVIIRDIASKLSDACKRSIATKWVLSLESHLSSDNWGEPASLFVDELFIPRICVQEISDATNNMNKMLNIIEMRREFVQISKRILNL